MEQSVFIHEPDFITFFITLKKLSIAKLVCFTCIYTQSSGHQITRREERPHINCNMKCNELLNISLCKTKDKTSMNTKTIDNRNERNIRRSIRRLKLNIRPIFITEKPLKQTLKTQKPLPCVRQRCICNNRNLLCQKYSIQGDL